METLILEALAQELLEAGVPVVALKAFGSRARHRSTEHSDLDVAVVLDAVPDRRMYRQVAETADRLSLLDAQTGYGLRVQAVPLFRGDEDGYLARAIAREAETVWTRT
jgi:predicted nucleotidyltransferase